MKMKDHLSHLSKQTWDAIVVGAGMGGCAAAFAMAQSGLRVLVLEKGYANPSAPKSGEGEAENPETRLRTGKWPTRQRFVVDSKPADILPVLGCGVGGSTLLYAGAMSRLEPSDFRLGHSTSNSWPYEYETLVPYYRRLEYLFGVNGTVDPRRKSDTYDLKGPPAMCERDRYFFQVMQEAGLKPYRLHNSIDYHPDCLECGGEVCEKGCKGDARNRLMLPALKTGKLALIDRIEVERIIADRTLARSVIASRNGECLSFQAKVIVLGAGALATPALLLKSRSEHWPAGIGNDKDQVGRNLMFHASDFIAVWPRKRLQQKRPRRTIASREFYVYEGLKLGEFQSMGLTAGQGEILTFLHQMYDRTFMRHIPLMRKLLHIPAFVAAKVFRDATVFTTVVEDQPLAENRVTLDTADGSDPIVEYHVPDELRKRVFMMRKLLREKLPQLRLLFVNNDVLLNYGHACGTCRSGLDPNTSVTDQWCRVHSMENLYVVDSSFMPTSGGTNPSLTIGANALRVGDYIANGFDRTISLSPVP